jgi:murein DD-endopeptidase MepM/ murein hydrolase activator NlpD
MKLRIASTLVVIGLGGAAWSAWPAESPLPQPPAATGVDLPAIAPRYRTTSHEIAEGDTASEVLRALGVDVEGVIAAAHGRLDHLSIGDIVHVDWRADVDHPWRVRLEGTGPTEAAFLWTGAAWTLEDRPIPYTVTSGAREMVVESSLWESALDAGLRPSQIVGIAKIFEYDVDFNTELAKGARIRLVADTLTAEDGSQRVGDIQAARLVNGSKIYTAVRYRMRDGSVGWFAPDGTGRRRPFLRSPLEFSRVTSGFSTGRFHPILKIKRPHLGVDFGAPTGTPVRAVADGVVTRAGPNGGHGNYIELDHEGPYATSYSHLSSIGVRRGQKVHQGDVIGRVGSTGLATGPHLHYQFYVNGQYRDPMTVDLPMTGSLPEAERDAFFAVRDAAMPLLDGVPAATEP